MSGKIVYTGGAAVREITAQQWDTAGIHGQEDTVWLKEEGWVLDQSAFTEGAIEVLKGYPGEFRFEDGDEEDKSDDTDRPSPTPVPRETPRNPAK